MCSFMPQVHHCPPCFILNSGEMSDLSGQWPPKETSERIHEICYATEANCGATKPRQVCITWFCRRSEINLVNFSYLLLQKRATQQQSRHIFLLDIKPVDVIRKIAQQWRTLSPDQKRVFIKQFIKLLMIL